MVRVPADRRIGTLGFLGKIALDRQVTPLEDTTNRQHHARRTLQLFEQREYGGGRNAGVTPPEPNLGDVEQLPERGAPAPAANPPPLPLSEGRKGLRGFL